MRKLIALAVTLVMLLSFITLPAAAAPETTLYPDAPTYSVDFTSRTNAQEAANTYVSNWAGVGSGKLTGSYNGMPFDLQLIGGNTDSSAGMYRPNGAGRRLLTRNASGSVLVKAPFKIEVDLSTESASVAGIGEFIIRERLGNADGEELGRIVTRTGTASQNRDIYTFEYLEENENGIQLSFETNRGDTGFRARLYSIKIYEGVAVDPGEGTPRITILDEPADITATVGRINANTRLTVNAMAIDTDPQLSYQWYKAAAADGSNGAAISGATDASYMIPADTGIGTYYYYCVISAADALDVTTKVATVSVSSGEFTSWGSNRPTEWGFGFQRVSFMLNNPEMYFNDALASVDPSDNTVTPILLNSEFYLPYGAAASALGEETSWKVTETDVTVSSGGKTAVLAIGNEAVYENGILYLPVKSIVDELQNASIGWDPESKVMVITTGAAVNPGRVTHSAMNSQPDQWYGSTESLRLADNLLLFQRNSGGWYKNVDFAQTMTDQLRASLLASKNSNDSTIDNGATIPEIQYLIKVYQATKIERYRDSYLLGLNAVLGCQYQNGGFPQYVDQRATYHGEVTFNDDAMAHILVFWMDVYNNSGKYFSVDTGTLERIEKSVIRGIACVLNAQIYSETQGMLTAWCAQHDRVNLTPTWARAYEPPSISGMESIPIIRFLMSLDRDFLLSLDAEDEDNIFGDQNVWDRVQNSIHSAVAFYARTELFGMRLTNGTSPWGNDRILVADEGARGLWGRFIDIETFDPLFVDRPGNGLGSDPLRFQTNPDERLTYGEINTGFMAGWKHAPTSSGVSRGGNLRNIYGEDGKLDIISSYARLTFERRNGYQFINTYGTALPEMYESWLEKNGLEAPVAGTVTFNLTGGEGEAGSKSVESGKPYGELPVPVREDYAFVGWSVDGTEDGIVTAETIVSIKGSHTLTAVWKLSFEDAKVRVSLSGDPAVTANDVAKYVVSVANTNKLATATLWFEVDGEYFAGKDVTGINGFDVLGGIQWTQAGGTLWSGRVTLTNMDGGLTSNVYSDIFKLTLAAKEELGVSDIRLTRIDLSGYDEDGKAMFFEPIIRGSVVSTEVLEYFSLYDVNRDGNVDQLDLTTAQLYYASREGDTNWDDAKLADVNGDRSVDIEDLIMILNNIVW